MEWHNFQIFLFCAGNSFSQGLVWRWRNPFSSSIITFIITRVLYLPFSLITSVINGDNFYLTFHSLVDITFPLHRYRCGVCWQWWQLCHFLWIVKYFSTSEWKSLHLYLTIEIKTKFVKSSVFPLYFTSFFIL